MPQLDLFSSPVKKETAENTALQPANSKTHLQIKEDNEVIKSMVELAEETLLNRKVAQEVEQEQPIIPTVVSNAEVVFANEKIGVRIKEKKVKPVAVKKAKPPRIPQKRGRKSLKEIEADLDLIDIPEDEELFKKQYYPISDVAKWFKVNTSLLRFWENEFDVLKPRKNRKGDRLFRPEDVKNLQLIYHLLRQRKYSIEGAKEFLKGDKDKADIQMQLTHSLQKLKSFLLELKANL